MLFTPDQRYLVVRGRLWRRSNPKLQDEERQALTNKLMAARRAIGAIKRGEPGDLKAARSEVNAAKIALGERGPVWWTDGTRDYTRHLVRNTPYKAWFDAQNAAE